MRGAVGAGEDSSLKGLLLPWEIERAPGVTTYTHLPSVQVGKLRGVDGQWPGAVGREQRTPASRWGRKPSQQSGILEGLGESGARPDSAPPLSFLSPLSLSLTCSRSLSVRWLILPSLPPRWGHAIPRKGGQMSSQEHDLQPLRDALPSPRGLLQRRRRAWIPDPAPWVRRQEEEGGGQYLQALRPLLPSWSVWSSGSLE